MLHVELPLGVLVDGERVDHAHGVVLAELLELRRNLAMELRLVETDHEQLYRSDCHRLSPSRRDVVGASGPPTW
jgi:hypothetical protein